jgi:hypothetical protein
VRRLRFALGALVAIAILAVAGAYSGFGSEERFSPDEQPAAVAAAYRFIAANPELAERLACYCGCGETMAHRHLRDCFWADDGRPDAHGAGCGVCLAEAIEAERLLAEGWDAAAIAEAIDDEFGPLGPPTRAR